MEADFARDGARRYVVRAAEGGKEIIERLLVGHVDDRHASAPLVAIRVEQVVVAQAEIE